MPPSSDRWRAWIATQLLQLQMVGVMTPGSMTGGCRLEYPGLGSGVYAPGSGAYGGVSWKARIDCLFSEDHMRFVDFAHGVAVSPDFWKLVCPGHPFMPSRGLRRQMRQYVCSKFDQLNGCNGEWTNSDDRRGGKQKKKQPEVDVKGGQLVRLFERLLAQRPVQRTRKVMKRSRNLRPGRALDAKNAHGHAYLEAMFKAHTRGLDPTGIPTFPVGKSQKVGATTVVTVSTGTAGVGFFGYNPSPAGDQVQFSYSGATYAGTTLPAMNAAAVGQSTGTLSLPYALASLTSPALEARIVGFSYKAHNTTAPLYVQGTTAAFDEVDHQTIGTYTFANMAARKESRIVPMQPGTVISGGYMPVQANDTLYGTSTWPANNSAAAVLGGFIISGANTTNVTTMQVEVGIVVEYIGSTCEQATTSNPIPPIGMFEHCVECAGMAKSAHSSVPDAHPDYVAETGQVLLDVVRGQKPPSQEVKQVAVHTLQAAAKGGLKLALGSLF